MLNLYHELYTKWSRLKSIQLLKNKQTLHQAVVFAFSDFKLRHNTLDDDQHDDAATLLESFSLFEENWKIYSQHNHFLNQFFKRPAHFKGSYIAYEDAFKVFDSISFLLDLYDLSVKYLEYRNTPITVNSDFHEEHCFEIADIVNLSFPEIFNDSEFEDQRDEYYVADYQQLDYQEDFDNFDDMFELKEDQDEADKLAAIQSSQEFKDLLDKNEDLYLQYDEIADSNLFQAFLDIEHDIIFIKTAKISCVSDLQIETLHQQLTEIGKCVEILDYMTPKINNQSFETLDEVSKTNQVLETAIQTFEAVKNDHINLLTIFTPDYTHVDNSDRLLIAS